MKRGVHVRVYTLTSARGIEYLSVMDEFAARTIGEIYSSQDVVGNVLVKFPGSRQTVSLNVSILEPVRR